MMSLPAKPRRLREIVGEARELLDDPRTGLRDSSNTNKTRQAIFALLDEALERGAEIGVEVANEML